MTITEALDGVIGVPARLLITACDATALADMNSHIDLGAQQLATCDCDLVIYMCTSGSFMNGNSGDEAIRQRLTELTGKPSISTSQAVISALKQLHLERVVMLTPYDADLTEREIEWLGENGVEVTDYYSSEIADNLDRGAQSPETLFRQAARLRWRDADGIFLSCGNVPYLEIIPALEQHTGRPVVASSPATTWMALRTVGVHDSIDAFGRLLEEASLN